MPRSSSDPGLQLLFVVIGASKRVRGKGAETKCLFISSASYNNNTIHSTGTFAAAAVQWELAAIIQRFEYNDWLGPRGDCSSLGGPATTL